MTSSADERFMREALREAQKAGQQGEIPIGAVVVCRNTIIARSHNLNETLSDPTAHAEMQAITMATHHLGGKYLTGCTLYVTIEPCPMCAAACRWSQIGRVVWGADDPKGGYRRYSETLMHPKTVVQNGVLAEECAELMKKFFAELRN